MMPASSQSALFEKEAAQPQFRRARDGDTAGNRPLQFDIVFADKKTKLAELQLADWGARPVELSDSRPQQANQAFDILKKKFFCDGGHTKVGRGYENVGLMIYLPIKAKSPDEPTEAVAPTGNPQSTWLESDIYVVRMPN